jgi:transcriptional regulator with XRE-family HTH domain
VQQDYTNSVLDGENFRPYHFGMTKTPKPSEMRIKRRAAGLSQIALAEAVGASQPQIRRLEGDQRKMTGPWALRISKHIPNTIPEDLVFGALTVNIVGYVAAGIAHFEPAYLGLARRPRGAGNDTVAVEIRGDSLPGLDGYIAYYDDRREMPTQIASNRYYVIGLETGEIMVKRLTRRAHHAINQFDLHGAYGDPIPDRFVSWAAMVIDFVPPERAKIEESQEEPIKPKPKTRSKIASKVRRAHK